MLSSLLRPRNKRRRSDRSPYSTPFNSSPLAVRAGNVDENENEEDENDEENDDYDEERSYNEDDEDDVDTPLLPIFSAAHLGMNILAAAMSKNWLVGGEGFLFGTLSMARVIHVGETLELSSPFLRSKSHELGAYSLLKATRSLPPTDWLLSEGNIRKS